MWLLFPPLYYSLSGRVSSLPRERSLSNLAATYAGWLMVASSAFGLFYFVVVVPASLWSGLNLNYMTSPPPVIDGTDYRIKSQGFIFAAFAVARALTMALEAGAEIIGGKKGETEGKSKETQERQKKGKEKSRKD